MSWEASTLLNPRGTSTPSLPTTTPAPALADSGLEEEFRRVPEDLTFQYSDTNGSYSVDASSIPYNRHYDLPHHPQIAHVAVPATVPARSTPTRVNSLPHPLRMTPMYQNGIGQQNGFATQIERLNNVQYRSDVPQPKRRKTQNENDPEPSAVFSGTGTGTGILGEHIQQQQHGEVGHHKPAVKQPVKTTPKSTETVDLTEGDSKTPDAQVVQGDPKDEEVCFGMVVGAQVHCNKVPAPKPGMFSLCGHDYWPQVKVVLRRRSGEKTNVIYVYDYTRTVFGMIDVKTSAALCPLLDTGNFQIRTDCRIPPRRKQPGEQIGQPVSSLYKLELMLYGPRRSANNVGSQLSSRGLNLVSPSRVEAGVKVVNPLATEKRPTPPATRPNGSSDALISHPPVALTVEEVRSEVMGVFDSLPNSEDLPEMDPSNIVVTPLLKHQRQALYFMTQREQDPGFDANDSTVRSSWRCKRTKNGAIVYHNVVTNQTQSERPSPTLGGILADMMGLGKTLSMLSLITSTLPAASRWEMLEPIQPKAPEKKVNQWDMPPKTQSFPLTPLVLNGRATLLICPLSTVTNWEEQLKQHIKPESISYHIYHGPNREKDVRKLAEFDLVITTYGSVSSELNFRVKNKKGIYPLEQIGWFRIVLDEAHMIREQSTLAFKSVSRLQANRRWAVTGTPVQNKLEDLSALLAFIRLKPFDAKTMFSQFIIQPFKTADPEIVPKLRVLIDTITLRRLKDKIDLPKREDIIVKLRFSDTERQIYDWFARNTQERVRVLTGQAVGQERMAGKAMIHILRAILQLRLICAHGKALLNKDDLAELKGMTAETPIDLSDDEEDQTLLQESKAYEYLYLMQEANNDICNKCRNKLGEGEIVDLEGEQKDDTLGYMCPAQCLHVYCPACIGSFRRQKDGDICEFCNQMDRARFVSLNRNRSVFEHESRTSKPTGSATSKKDSDDDEEDAYVPHTKTRALVQDLLLNKEMSRKNPNEPPYKSVVFSGWTSHMDLIEKAFIQEGIIFTRLDGKMSRPARNEAMERFRDDPTVQVILVSIMAGGLGLNLTSGNSVYVMEPQFNPAAEAQAVDRVHRLGQKRPVRTVRFIMEDSFEEKMLQLQEKKKRLASLSMDRDKEQAMDRTEAARQRLMDLRSLFK
ncbi:hypothetical protein OQA88_11921 [Cercophora sp. LCS_1]